MRARHGIAMLAATALFAAGAMAKDEHMSSQDFVDKAAQGGVYEVEAGKLAQEKGQSAAVKSFGQTLVTDHGKANTELKTLAGKMGLKVPDGMGAMHQAKMAKLKVHGDGFDKAFAEQMVKDHEEDIEAFTTASTTLDDPMLRQFASKTLPVLKHHLQMAEALPGAPKAK